MTLTAFAVLWDYGLLLMLLYNMRPGTPAFTILFTVFNLLCAAFDFVCYNFMEIIQFFLSIPIAIVVGYLNIDPAAIKYDVLYVRSACSRAVRGYLVAQRERACRRAVAAWHRGCGYADYQRKLHCWYADNICAMIVGSIEGRIRDIMDECTTFIYLTPPLAETYMTIWQAWLWLLWMRDGASLLMSYLPAFHKPSSNSTSATEQSTPNASRSTTPVSDNEAPAPNSSPSITPEPQTSAPQPSSENESPRTNPVAESERAERRERRERKKREERAARKREADLRAARSKEERERRQLQERLAREAEERRLEQEEQDRRLVQEEQERQRKAREQAAQEEERQRQAREQAALEKERQRKAQEQAELEKERQRKAYEQAALEKARSQSTAGQLLKQAIAKAATEQKTKPQPTVPLAPAGAASVQLPKTLPPVVLQTTGPTLPFSLSAVPSMTAHPPRTPSTASTQPSSQPIPLSQAPVLQQRQEMNLQPRHGQGQNVPQQLRPQPQQSTVGTLAGSLASPNGPQAIPAFFPSGTARQRAAAGLPFPISTPPSAPAAPVTLAPPASALPLQSQSQPSRTREDTRLAVLARIAALKQEAQQVQPQSQPQQQPQQPKPQLPIFNAQPTPISSVAGPSAASVQPTLFPPNALQVTSSSNRTGTFSGGFNGAVVGPSMPAFPSTTIPIHPVNIPQPQAVAEPMEIDTPTPFIHHPSPPPESDLMDIDDIEMEDAWQADCSATLSSDILPLSAPPTMEVDDGWPESCPSPEWFPLATPQPSRPVTPAPLSPPPTVVRSPEIVMEVLAVPQNAPTPLPIATSPATPPKAAPPREVTAPTTFSVPLKPAGTAVSASSVTPKPAQGPSSSTPPKATLSAWKQSATPTKPTDPPKAPTPVPAAAKDGPSSIPQSSAPAKPSSVTPPASQAKSPSSLPPAAPRIDAGSAKAPSSTSPAKAPPKKFGFATTRKPAEKKEDTEDKPILFKDKRQFPPDAKKPAVPSVVSG
ncbi:hypothetical protein K525DRAFT_207500 [Schizophyllum commune Loenen D]|nr:hypothetical protein K525DRAFT_207500 [Schizophyllum commune Loenen D]